MIDINVLRENPDAVKASERKRGKDQKQVDIVLKLDQQWKKELKELEQLKRQRNLVSEEINQAKKARDEKTAKNKIKKMREVADDIKNQEEKVDKLLHGRNVELGKISNVMHPGVPEGKDDSQNVELKTWGKKPEFNFEIKTHVELCENLDLADFETSAKTSGNGFYFLKGKLGLLNQALIRFAIDFMDKKCYQYIEPPLLIRKQVLNAAIDASEWDKTIYSISGEDLALIGTSEHSLLGIHTGEALTEKQLPKKYFSYSMCFRKEVGAHGINDKGLWRTHQFNKVEQFIFCNPEDSEKFFSELLQNSEEILQALKLPYRVIEICAGDLAAWKHKSYDLEVWRPTTKEYGEVMSLSNCTDYQARKLDIKVERSGTRTVLHTLNNTALATSRIMVAILENNQTKKGTIKVPKVLVQYMNGLTEID
ncbi:MAG TPA: serine--tRNA ligase [Candidatus Nanoarchaeia archaeon]|nr:serine--tRNA ligase [Candidatus Nanoarchaeia archaeon]